MRYYFNIKDGQTTLDDEGTELADMDAVKVEAVHSGADLIKGMQGAQFWTGEPWSLWVTDKPSGGGNTILTLTLSSCSATDRLGNATAQTLVGNLRGGEPVDP